MSPALHSKSGCKFSQGRTSLRQQQNTELKFSTSSKEEDESNKPCSREKIALPREQEAINKKQNRLLRLQTCRDSCNCSIFLLPWYAVQFNSFWTPQFIHWCRRFEKCHLQNSQRKRSGETVHSGCLQSKFSLCSSMQLYRQQELHNLYNTHKQYLSHQLSWEQPVSHYTIRNNGFRVIGDGKIVL